MATAYSRVGPKIWDCCRHQLDVESQHSQHHHHQSCLDLTHCCSIKTLLHDEGFLRAF